MSENTSTPEPNGDPVPPLNAPPAGAADPIVAAAAPTPPAPRSALGLWAMIAGIVALVSALAPGLSFVAWMPAIAAIVLGVIALARKTSRRGQALTGVILGPIAWIVAIAVSVGAIAGLAGNSMGEANDDEPPALVEEQPDQEEPAEEPEPEPEVIEPTADIVYEGVGDSVLQIELPAGPDSIGIASFTHSGSSNFAIWSLDEALTQSELLVNTIGNYAGTVPFNLSTSERITAFEISADGPWVVTLRDVLTVREAPQGGSTTGQGDDVLLYFGDATVADVTHTGESNFAIWSYGGSSDLLVNEIGNYTGSVRWQAGDALIQVSADGPWTIVLQ